MKRIIINMLPVMAAVLLATSCGKDDNDSNVVINDVVDNGISQTETVTNGVTTIKVTGKLSQASLSKVTVKSNTDRTLKFEGGEDGEVFVFGTENIGSGWGTIKIDDEEVHYTAILNFPTGKESDFFAGSYTAELNKENANLPAADGGLTKYDNLATAVKNAYYTIDFKVETNTGGDGTPYKLKSDGKGDIKVYVKSAFIHVLSDEKDITVGGTTFKSVEGGYYVVPENVNMGSGQNKTAAGKIYKANRAVPKGYVYLGVDDADGQEVYFSASASSERVWDNIHQTMINVDVPTIDEWKALAEGCYWVWGQKNGTYGVYAFQLKSGETSNYNDLSESTFDDYYKTGGKAPYIFLPVYQNEQCGMYWSSTKDDDVDPPHMWCFYFDSYNVETNNVARTDKSWLVRQIKRSK